MLRTRQSACFDLCKKLGFLAAMTAAKFNPALSASSSLCNTLLTRPARRASRALNSLPLRVTSKIQLLLPTNLGSRRRSIGSAASDSRRANEALTEEMRMSQAQTNCTGRVEGGPKVTQITAGGATNCRQLIIAAPLLWEGCRQRGVMSGGGSRFTHCSIVAIHSCMPLSIPPPDPERTMT